MMMKIKREGEDMDYLVHNIAINFNHIRKAKGMSLDVVAEQTGVSKSMLAAIEKGAANPSIGVLGKIMSGLRIEHCTHAKDKDVDGKDARQISVRMMSGAFFVSRIYLDCYHLILSRRESMGA